MRLEGIASPSHCSRDKFLPPGFKTQTHTSRETCKRKGSGVQRERGGKKERGSENEGVKE